MGFNKFKQTLIGDESHENKQTQNISQNEIESDCPEHQVVPKKVKDSTKDF
jgi:hypothetical protein